MQAFLAPLALAELEPAGHARQTEAVVLPVSAENVPAGHGVHPCDPGVVLYVPATHCVQGPPLDPAEPALQRQFVGAGLPARECENAVQAEHVEISEAPDISEYLPTTQSVHGKDPAPVLYFPATHNWHPPPSGPVAPALHVQAVETGLPAAENEFTGHAEHVTSEVAAEESEYFPGSQSVQGPTPSDSLCLPAAQCVHAPPSGPEYPALQRQSAKASLAAGEIELVWQPTHDATSVAAVVVRYLPALHAEHTADPEPVLYVPAPHCTHVPPSGPVAPGMHLQAVKTSLPDSELECAGHVKHCEASNEPTASEYEPDAQSAHVSDPTSVLYFPATHCVHGPPSGPV